MVAAIIKRKVVDNKVTQAQVEFEGWVKGLSPEDRGLMSDLIADIRADKSAWRYPIENLQRMLTNKKEVAKAQAATLAFIPELLLILAQVTPEPKYDVVPEIPEMPSWYKWEEREGHNIVHYDLQNVYAYDEETQQVIGWEKKCHYERGDDTYAEEWDTYHPIEEISEEVIKIVKENFKVVDKIQRRRDIINSERREIFEANETLKKNWLAEAKGNYLIDNGVEVDGNEIFVGGQKIYAASYEDLLEVIARVGSIL